MTVSYFEIKKQTLAKIVAFVITIILVAILLSQVEIGDVVSTLAGIDSIHVIIGFVLYTCSYFFRALRFYVLLNKEVRLRDLFNIVCVHNMLNNILPARTGELSYIYLLKKLHNKKAGEGIATLVVVRVSDFIAISALFFVSCLLMASDLPGIVITVIWTIAFSLVLVISVSVVSVYFGEKITKIVEKINIRLNLDKFRIIPFLANKGVEVKESFRRMQSKKVVFCCLLLSVPIWSSIYAMVYVLLNGMGLNLIIWLVIVGMTLLMLLNFLPVQGIGKFGTYEGAWAVIFIPLGLSKEIAITSGFSVHIITIVFFLILGCYGMFMLKFRTI